METKKIKEVRPFGNSFGIIFDKEMLYKSEIKVGDKVEVSCAKNRITIRKPKQENKGE